MISPTPYLTLYGIITLLPSLSLLRRKKKKTGSTRMDDRKTMLAIFYILSTDCQWNAIPRSLGASSTVHDRFQEWGKAGVFRRMWMVGLSVYDRTNRIDWKWQAMDGRCFYKGTSWGKSTEPNPSHRQK